MILQTAKIVEVVELSVVEENPRRVVRIFFDRDGNLLFVLDPAQTQTTQNQSQVQTS